MKLLLLDILSKILNIFFKKNLDGVIVLTTHEVKKENLLNFESRIKEILKTHTFISPKHFFNYIEGEKPLEGKSVLMTFDDGFLSSFNATVKILDNYNIKAIFFIPTGILDLNSVDEEIKFLKENIYFKKYKKKKFDKEDHSFMKMKHLKILSDNGHMLCPHTYSHVKLNAIKSNERFYDELVRPRDFFNKIFLNKVNTLAIPVGSHRVINKLSFNKIVSIYNYNFMTIRGFNNRSTNPHLLFRSNFSEDCSSENLKKILKGFHNIFYKFRMNRLIKKVTL